MAENESLDLGNPYAWRWKAVYEAVRKGEPHEEVAKRVLKNLHQGLRKALKQLAEKGVSLETLLANRDFPPALRRLLKQSEGHEYAALFADTAIVEKDSGTEGLLDAFVSGVWDTISDQITHNVAGSERWPSLVDVQIYLNEVRNQIEPDMGRIAEKLATDPSWLPICKRENKAEKVDPTAEMLPMSLLGIQKK